MDQYYPKHMMYLKPKHKKELTNMHAIEPEDRESDAEESLDLQVKTANVSRETPSG